MNVDTKLHLRAALHEVRCWECRVTWKSWLQRLIGMEQGYTPKVSDAKVARARAKAARIRETNGRVPSPGSYLTDQGDRVIEVDPDDFGPPAIRPVRDENE